MITGQKRKFTPATSNEAPEAPAATSGEETNNRLYPTFSPPSSSRFNNKVLYDYLRNPSLYPDAVVYNDDKCVIIKDAYPKAAIHLLLLPKETFLVKNSVKEFTFDDLERVRALHDCAKSFATQVRYALTANEVEEQILGLHLPANFLTEIRRKHARQNIGDFLFGYHILPSLFPLHLHIISSDFISSYLKTKRHWNSFTTRYFVDSDLVENLLEAGQSIRTVYVDEECEKFLNLRLRCCHCGDFLSNIPELKRHLPVHFPLKIE